MRQASSVPFDSIVFDLDGTLIDTAPDLAAALNHVLEGEGRRCIEVDDIRHLVGRGARVAIERGLALTGEPETRAEALDAHLARFLDFYSANVCVGSRAFPGVMDLIRGWRAEGARTGICTNKPQALTDKLLDALDIAHHFDAVVGADAVAERKPAAGHLLETLRRMGADRDSAVMVGDSETDVRTARAAGVPVVLVSFGYTVTPAAELGADAVIEHYEDLPGALAELRARAA